MAGRLAALAVLATVTACSPAAHSQPTPTPGPAPTPAASATAAPARAAPISYGVGCLRNRSAAAVDEFFRARVGPILGMDDPHVTDLGNDRYLWIFHDAFLHQDDDVDVMFDAWYLHNVALLQEGRCFRLFHRGTRAAPSEFEPGDVEPDTGLRYFWPLGGEVRGSRLLMFWAEMHHDPDTPRNVGGINRHPERTWLAQYDAETLQRLSFEPAPNDGVDPQWGYAVAGHRRYSYLFGNTNMLNYHLVGGWLNGPHTATRMYLARVRRGRLRTTPQYLTANGWSGRAGRATPISERFWAENQMQPRRIGGRWVAVTKVDGFAGQDIVVDVARRPGRWRTVQRLEVDPQGDVPMVTYHPIVLPWRDPSGDLIVVISRNAINWDDAVRRDASRYRVMAFTVPFPD